MSRRRPTLAEMKAGMGFIAWGRYWRLVARVKGQALIEQLDRHKTVSWDELKAAAWLPEGALTLEEFKKQ